MDLRNEREKVCQGHMRNVTLVCHDSSTYSLPENCISEYLANLICLIRLLFIDCEYTNNDLKSRELSNNGCCGKEKFAVFQVLTKQKE
jgi:hypothetical protein